MMTKDVLITILKAMEVGKYFSYPVNLPPNDVNEVLEGLGLQVDISEDWNGCDLDWSLIDNLMIDDKEFQVWGSGFDGSLMFQRK